MTKLTAVITSPINSISNRLSSHRSTDPHIYKSILEECYNYDVVIDYGNKIEDYNKYDEIFVYHGNDFGGSLNLFGGIENESLAKNITKFSKCNVLKIRSLNIDFPDYASMLKERLKKKPCCMLYDDVNWGNLHLMSAKCFSFILKPNNWRNIIIGDSHTTSLYRPNYIVNPIPFKTLYGFLDIDIEDIIFNKYEMKMIDSVGFCFGNIDIRHHICRQETPLISVRNLASSYLFKLKEFQKKYPNLEIDIYELLPIENESRKIPKTGWYKGKPFWGSWEERNDMRNQFNSLIEIACDFLNDFKFIKWTDYLKNDKGELDFKFMEKPQSVHLSREFYPYWNGINNNKNKNNNNLEDFFGG